MKRGKSSYAIYVNASSDKIHYTIQNFLTAYGFKMMQEDGNFYYQGIGAGVVKNLEYTINDGMVTVLAYVGSYKKPIELDDKPDIYRPGKQEYLDQLKVLFEYLKKLNPKGVEYRLSDSYAQLGNRDTARMEKKENKAAILTILSVILSLLALILKLCLDV